MVSEQRPPIASDWKISKVLEVYPELLDVIAGIHPALGKIRNPLIRKVQTKLVTVQQAAGVAGVDPTEFLQQLNAAVGHESPESQAAGSPTEPAEIPDWVTGVTIARELDVRPMLQRGDEPFTVISEASRAVRVGEALALRTTFDPIPLRDVLAKQGFESHTTGSGDDWTTLFYRVRELTPAAKPAAIASAEPATVEISIDVSELVPPEPMMKILNALEELPDGGRLVVHHVRRPMHLYPRLDELGYAHATEELASDHVVVTIDKTVSYS
ncbi:MAG: DUF2249 domain-containing protein [Thermomicrobiales bacterium]|nr:DUF2249 domain-containing protein [Thermomicrobiales bacterium]